MVMLIGLHVRCAGMMTMAGGSCHSTVSLQLCIARRCCILYQYFQVDMLRARCIRSTAVAVAGSDYCIVAASTRLSTGYSILTRECSKLITM